MNESPIRKFCESSHRKLIVVIVSTLAGLVVLIPLADDYFDKKESRRTLAEELDRARQTAKMLPDYEKRLTSLNQELGEYEVRSVSQKSISQYRSKLVELIRDSDCKVRRIEVSNPTSRPWFANDDPLKKPVAKGSESKKTPFTLFRTSVALTLDGTMDNINGFLEKLHKEKTFAYPRRLELHGAGHQGGSVAIELELWLFALDRNKTT